MASYILSNFDFQIKFIKRESFIPNHSTRGICRIHKNMAQKKKPLKPIKKSPNYKKSHSVLSEKFMSLYYEHYEVIGSCSHFKHHIPSASLSRDIDSSSESLPFVENSFPTNPFFNNTNTLSDYINCIFEWQGRYEILYIYIYIYIVITLFMCRVPIGSMYN